jgi:hypothetical protein
MLAAMIADPDPPGAPFDPLENTGHIATMPPRAWEIGNSDRQ